MRREAWRQLALCVRPVGAALVLEGGASLEPEDVADDVSEEEKTTRTLTHDDIAELIRHMDEQGDGDGEINRQEVRAPPRARARGRACRRRAMR